MIAALRGMPVHWDGESSTLWLDVGGVVYELLLPAFAAEWAESLEEGAEAHFFTYYHVAERNPRPVLIGFPHLAERDFFRKFIEVPDVGPIKAVRALTHPVSEIARWIEGGDTKSLQQLPGIGTRLAQTIVARLQGRLTLEALLPDDVAATRRQPETPDLRDDAIEGLVTLQYSRREAERVVDEVLAARPEIDDLETLLRLLLERRAPAR